MRNRENCFLGGVMTKLRMFIVLIMICGYSALSYCSVGDFLRMLYWSNDKKHVAIVNQYDHLVENNDYNAKDRILRDKNAQEIKNLKIKFDPRLKDLYKRSEEMNKQIIEDKSFGNLFGEKMRLIKALDNDPRYMQEQQDLEQNRSIAYASLFLKYHPEFKEKMDAIKAEGKLQDESYIKDKYPDVSDALWKFIFNSASQKEVNEFGQESNKNNRLLMEKYQPQLKVIEQNIETHLKKGKEAGKKLQAIMAQKQQLENKLEENSDYRNELANLISRQTNEEMELIKQYDPELAKKIEDLKQNMTETYKS